MTHPTVQPVFHSQPVTCASAGCTCLRSESGVTICLFCFLRGTGFRPKTTQSMQRRGDLIWSSLRTSANEREREVDRCGRSLSERRNMLLWTLLLVHRRPFAGSFSGYGAPSAGGPGSQWIDRREGCCGGGGRRSLVAHSLHSADSLKLFPLYPQIL